MRFPRRPVWIFLKSRYILFGLRGEVHLKIARLFILNANVLRVYFFFGNAKYA